MKKIIFTLSLLFSVFFSAQLLAQACGSVPACTPQGGPLSGGFDESSTIPCAVQDSAYNYSAQFTMFTTFNFQGSQVVDSIEFVSIDNLPCGLCWSVNKPNKRYVASEDGCLNIRGTTNDAAGQYKLAIALNAWINGNTNAFPVSATLFDGTDIRIIFRVKTAAGTCVTVDTAANAPGNLTASISCNTGVSDLISEFSSLRITPNPINSNSVVSFTSTEILFCTMRISDVTGKIVVSQEIEAKQGANSIAIEKNDLAAGVYFLSLTDGKNATTTRFYVTD
ncbi:MAG: T9SS type A sorting domain-containing protein [Bacteroidota bacterium]